MRVSRLKTWFVTSFAVLFLLAPRAWAGPQYHDDLIYVLSLAKKFALKHQAKEIGVEHLARALMSPLGGAKHEDIPPTALFTALRNEHGWSLNTIGAAARELDTALGALPKSETVLETIPQSATLKEFMETADKVATEFGQEKTTPAHLLIAFADAVPKSVAEPIKRLKLDRERIAKGAYMVDPDTALDAKKKTKTTAIEKYCRNYAELVDTFDPVIGREPQIREVVEILGVRKKRNVVLIGEPGVGKTAIVEGFQREIKFGNVPDNLAGKIIVELDIGQIIAGASKRGELEDRIKEVLNELETDPKYVLFIDELHTMMELGKAEGGSNIGDLLKPALARGKIMTIGSTTEDEIEALEKDGAMDRRWQRVEVPEPGREDTMEILYNVKPLLEEHHGVTISMDAVEAAYETTKRYQLDRRQPDAAITALDRGASVLAQDNVAVEKALAKRATGEPSDVKPFNLDLIDKRIKQLRDERERLQQRDKNPVVEHRMGVVEKQLAGLNGERAELKQAWDHALDIAMELRLPATDVAKQKALRDELGKIQRRHRIVFDTVERFQVATAVSRMTRRPIGGMMESDKERLDLLESRMLERIKGQDHAVKTVADAVRTARGGMGEPGRPPTIILAGKTGGGKTLTAEVLSELLFDSDSALVTINLGDFAEPTSVSRLIGADPNYVGFGEPAQLTDPIRKRPDAVVLGDELDKAHKDGRPNDRLFNMLLAPMDKGRLIDSRSRTINFAGTVMIFTTNVGSELADIEGLTDSERSAMARMLLKRWGLHEAFLGRTDHVIVMRDLDPKIIRQILDLELGKVQTVNLDAMGVRMTVDEAAKVKLTELSDTETMGARGLRPTVGTYVRGLLDELNRKHGQDLHDVGEVHITHDPATDQFLARVPSVTATGEKSCEKYLAEVGRDAKKQSEGLSPERMEQVFGKRQPPEPEPEAPREVPVHPPIVIGGGGASGE